MANSNTDFYGLSTHEWIGRVLSYESQQEQLDGSAGWGYRYRVAIMGYHPHQGSIKDEEITYALVALGVSDGSGAGGRKKDPAISPGDVVLGKFLDGDARQTPIILHVLARPDTAVSDGTGRFDTKTGYVGSNIKQSLLNKTSEQGNRETSGNRGLNLPIGISPSKSKKGKPPTEQLKKQGIDSNQNKVGAIKEPTTNTEEFTYTDPETGLTLTGTKLKLQSTTVAEIRAKRKLFNEAIQEIKDNNDGMITSKQWDEQYEKYLSGDVDPSTRASDMVDKLQNVSDASPSTTERIYSKYNADGTVNEEWAKQQFTLRGYEIVEEDEELITSPIDTAGTGTVIGASGTGTVIGDDDWLGKFYRDNNIGGPGGVLDEDARAYWEGQAVTRTINEVKESIERTAKNNRTWNLTTPLIVNVDNDWLGDFYRDNNIGGPGGTLNISARTYWEGEAKTKTIEEVKATIKGTAENNGTWNLTTSPTNDWLGDFYRDNNIGGPGGVLDATARTYWEGEAVTNGIDATKATIKGTAELQGTWNKV